MPDAPRDSPRDAARTSVVGLIPSCDGEDVTPETTFETSEKHCQKWAVTR